MRKRPFSLNSCLTRARLAIQDGRIEEGVDELRTAIFEAATMAPAKGRGQVEKVLNFARENEVIVEVEEILDDDALRKTFFGQI